MTTKLAARRFSLSSRVTILLDPDDRDTPVIVSAKVNGTEYTSTFWAVTDTGCVGNDDEYQLTRTELEGIERRYDQCSDFYDAVRSN